MVMEYTYEDFAPSEYYRESKLSYGDIIQRVSEFYSESEKGLQLLKQKFPADRHSLRDGRVSVELYKFYDRQLKAYSNALKVSGGKRRKLKILQNELDDSTSRITPSRPVCGHGLDSIEGTPDRF